MTFRELDIGDYFVHWDTIDGCYYMYWKNSEYNARYIDENLKELDWNHIPFSSDDIVYKVIV